MGLARILLADDQEDFLEARSELIRREGYDVITAISPTEARNILETQAIDVAILDLRLKGGGKEDTSGLDLAKSVAPYVPKIILTAHNDDDAIVEGLRVNSEGLPYVVDWVKKSADNDHLMIAVRKALVLASRFHRSIEVTSSQLDQDYRDARTQARWNYVASLVVSIGGIAIIFVGAVLVLSDVLATGIVSAVAGVIAEAIGYLFFKRVDSANDRMDRYHEEGLQIRRLEIALNACGELPANLEQPCKNMVIEKAASLWFDRDKPGD